MEQTVKQTDLFKVAEIELIYRTKVKASERPQVKGSKSAYDILLQLWDHNKIEFVEQFKILLLNRGNRVLGIFELSTGGTTGTVADPRIILATAIKANACGIVICHNHPSGEMQPSKADEELTKKIKGACNLHDIILFDHIILAKDNYFSFADEGLL